MSMVGCFLLVDAALIERLLAEPVHVTQAVERAYAEHPEDLVDVDKAWHCLHYLLTGTAWDGHWPTNFIVSGGTEVGDVDVGYGPARAIRPDELAEIARALSTLSGRGLSSRFSAREMESLEIYPGGQPGGWSGVDPSSEDSFGYFTAAFDELRNLVNRGVTRGQGMLVWLT